MDDDNYPDGEAPGFDLWPFLLINDKIAAILYSIHGVSVGCYYGGFEVFGSLVRYTTWVQTPWEIVENLINNFGFIYTGFRNIYQFFIKDGRTPIKNEYGLALVTGQIYYYLLISRYFSELTYTVSPSPLDVQTGEPIINPGIQIIQPPTDNGVLVISK